MVRAGNDLKADIPISKRMLRRDGARSNDAYAQDERPPEG
jgi:hypothetical protein